MKHMNEMNLNELRNVSGGDFVAPENPFPVFDFDSIRTDPDPDFPDGLAVIRFGPACPRCPSSRFPVPCPRPPAPCRRTW